MLIPQRLRAYGDQVALALYRPLNPELYLPDNKCTAGQMCLSICYRILQYLSQYEHKCLGGSYSGTVAQPLYTSTMTLLNLLDAKSVSRSTVHELFGKACRLLDRLSNDTPICKSVRRAMKAIMQRRDMEIPICAKPHLVHLEQPQSETQGVDLVIPHHEKLPTIHIEEVIEDTVDVEQHRPVGLHLGNLIKQWSKLCLD